MATLLYESPAADVHFTCGSWVLDQPELLGQADPKQTMIISGFTCKTVTTFSGYRQVGTRTLPVSLSPVTARTPDDRRISGKIVVAEYPGVVVVAGSDRIDTSANQLIGLGIGDSAELWRLRCPRTLAMRFAVVPAGDNPELGHITRNETEPTVVATCEDESCASIPWPVPHDETRAGRRSGPRPSSRSGGASRRADLRSTGAGLLLGVHPRRRVQPTRLAEQPDRPLSALRAAAGPRARWCPPGSAIYVSTSYPVCKEVLRSRSFGAVPADGSDDLVHQEGLDLSLLVLNPPDHTRIRRLAAPAFTPRRMAGYAGTVDRVISELLDRAERQQDFDLMTTFAAPLPIAVMTQLLGLPNDSERFRRLGAIIGQALDGVWSIRQARTLTAADAELRTMFDELLSERAAAPGDDLVSALVAEQGETLTGDGAGRAGPAAADRRLRNHRQRDRQRHAVAAGGSGAVADLGR